MGGESYVYVVHKFRDAMMYLWSNVVKRYTKQTDDPDGVQTWRDTHNSVAPGIEDLDA